MQSLIAPAGVPPVSVRSFGRRLPRGAAAVVGCASFETFYVDQIGSLVRALSATLVDPALASDAAQEAMTRAYERWDTVGQYSNPTAWCFRVATNWSTSRWRKRRREVAIGDVGAIGRLDRVSLVAELEPMDFGLLSALKQLDHDQRAVVVLRLWMDWSCQECAIALDIPRGTVGSRLHRGLARLRELLLADEEFANS